MDRQDMRALDRAFDAIDIDRDGLIFQRDFEDITGRFGLGQDDPRVRAPSPSTRCTGRSWRAEENS